MENTKEKELPVDMLVEDILEVDVVMPVDSSKLALRLMTQQTIDSLLKSEPDIKFNIFVIDSNEHTVGFKDAKTILYDFPFNYHKCLNLGIGYGNAPYIVLCNNDLLFEWRWLTKTIRAMGDVYMSASPNNKPSKLSGIIEGYVVAKHVMGWCIVVKRDIFQKIGKLDESVNFWYSDNIYAEQLKRAGLKHILVLHAKVLHLGSRTLMMIKNKYRLTKEQGKIFSKWKKHLN